MDPYHSLILPSPVDGTRGSLSIGCDADSADRRFLPIRSKKPEVHCKNRQRPGFTLSILALRRLTEPAIWIYKPGDRLKLKNTSSRLSVCIRYPNISI
jgi:hypothetical protein